ncbi:AAA family ATPase [Acetobacter pasteurianus]|uniref:AAA family ATPase n=1 Tax=Acetobacter pasteurianus TaxID=438 RepID=UPI0003843389|nr:ATP-binding protein [Acetobacter pasteurianus]CCT60387.1 hypothetical protein APA386B_2347 [Acetobacter pasteurianus 386B]
MLLNFTFSNHKSFRGEASLSLVASSLSDEASGLLSSEALPANKKGLPSAVIYGPNAAGKSAIVSAFDTMRDHVLLSHRHGKPGGGVIRFPFALDEKALKLISYFSIEFTISSVRYSYEFSTDGKSYISESLYSLFNGRTSKLYERKGEDFSFGRSLKGQNRTISNLTRPNSLFLSAAAQNDHPQLLEIFKYFQDLIIGPNIAPLSSSLATKDKIDPRVISFLTLIGTGIVDVSIKKTPVTPKAMEMQKELRNVFKKFVGGEVEFPDDDDKQRFELQLGHRSAEKKIKYLDISQESSGTINLLNILTPIFDALDHGKLIVIDELDESLHTQAVEAVIALFSDPLINKNGAQLVCTVHDTNILDSKFLRRDQIWFVNKDREGKSELYPLSDIKLRKQDSRERGYRQGRFGAVPHGSLESWLNYFHIERNVK